jgi:hypothetical protein
MAARALGVFVFMVASLSPTILTALPISSTTSITVGDKLFDNFEFFVAQGLCCPPPFGASDISVTPLVGTDGSLGLRFEGPFSKALFADGGQPWNFAIFFDVTTLDGSSRIDGSRLAFDAEITEGGFADVISILRTSSGDFAASVSVIAAETFMQLENSTQLPVPLDRVRNTLGFGVAGAGSVDFTRVDQTFTQTTVPEPSVFVLLSAGLVMVAASRAISPGARSKRSAVKETPIR